MILELIIGKLVVGKLVAAHAAAAHSAHALAAKEALVVHHPLSTATHMAFNHGIKYAMTHPEVATATTIPHVPLLNPVATGAAAASSAPTNLLHAAGMLAIPAKAAVTRRAVQAVRESELCQKAQHALSEAWVWD